MVHHLNLLINEKDWENKRRIRFLETTEVYTNARIKRRKILKKNSFFKEKDKKVSYNV